jgi:integration host factor subunit alpha
VVTTKLQPCDNGVEEELIFVYLSLQGSGSADKMPRTTTAITVPIAAGSLTRAELSDAVHNEIGLSRIESAALVEMVLDRISDALLAGDNVKISSFGSFMLREKGLRIGRNPKTGVEVPIQPRTVLTFRPSQLLREAINEKA